MPIHFGRPTLRWSRTCRSVASASRANDNELIFRSSTLKFVPRAEGIAKSGASATDLQTISRGDLVRPSRVRRSPPSSLSHRSETASWLLCHRRMFFEGGRYSTGHRVLPLKLFCPNRIVYYLRPNILAFGSGGCFFRPKAALHANATERKRGSNILNLNEALTSTAAFASSPQCWIGTLLTLHRRRSPCGLAYVIEKSHLAPPAQWADRPVHHSGRGARPLLTPQRVRALRPNIGGGGPVPNRRRIRR